MKGLAVGQEASASRIFTSEDVQAYRQLTEDVGLRFGQDGVETAVLSEAEVAVPGPLLAGMFSDLLGTKLPGRGTNWLKQHLHFPAVAKVGEEITGIVKITRLRPEKQLVNLQTTCTNISGNIVCNGETLVLVSDLETNK
ncbi:MAG: phosphate acetyltransferase [Chloroflexi bacterium]|nr:phosphate acetyltransferase [Chloroflexota bacterium]